MYNVVYVTSVDRSAILFEKEIPYAYVRDYMRKFVNS